ncbi:MAG TPA: transcriptional regulator [Algoriphagus sp.]|jgi:ArsR family transcriptional regulator|uniref:Transcriptional regulator, ArsR family n=1 Tax=Algoriphagus ornithinivorans TaxID=226506 RepID=A0A1I5JCI5_9BACT|nr:MULTISPECIES: metalloregulator ArsR/SmtB family transcription factor [Algoriphagus]MAL13928.1 transcriptional regulator [Algoriphagus sp.]MAN86927.1 transcriptional regulator [Algoriphagus sp.]QYH37285.1 metalloregulator ArsR/SmtB family transcription factor [Algoriphagus sp. NBT04N3]SFO70487.1 transcriptional regulator, ArsR family [Algoriphagus ornithinivorans]HCB44891.1 transcriptional regulator [Algoriphagus sp.]|tara:strand:- start:676 stop:1059 length:384 start_codon:yes stop_codon:yes gene_type:complete
MRLKNISLNYGLRIFKALSEEPRVRIIHLLMLNKELTISDLEHILDFTQTKTSRHLIYLKNAGLLGSRRVDQWMFYYILEEYLEIIQQIFKFIQKDPNLIRDQETFEILKSNRELAINKIQNNQYRK